MSSACSWEFRCAGLGAGVVAHWRTYPHPTGGTLWSTPTTLWRTPSTRWTTPSTLRSTPTTLTLPTPRCLWTEAPLGVCLRAPATVSSCGFRCSLTVTEVSKKDQAQSALLFYCFWPSGRNRASGRHCVEMVRACRRHAASPQTHHTPRLTRRPCGSQSA